MVLFTLDAVREVALETGLESALEFGLLDVADCLEVGLDFTLIICIVLSGAGLITSSALTCALWLVGSSASSG